MVRNMDQDRDFMAGLAKGLAVIEAFDDEHETMTIAEVAAATGLSRAAARRCLHTLMRLGHVAQDGRSFTLTPRVLKLGYAFLTAAPLPQLLQPFLEQASEALQESCSASVLDGTEIVYIARAATRRIMSVGVAVGTRLPAVATSMGRVLLAGLPPDEASRRIAASERRRLTPYTVTAVPDLVRAVDAARTDGYAIVEQELEVGLVSIAVPVIDARGRVVAALNAGLQAQRGERTLLVATVLPKLLETQRLLRPLVR
jgi:IclR family transcriptional regulator, pca regulon regulatory protein